MNDVTQATLDADARRRTQRKRALLSLAALVVLGLAAYGIYWALFQRHYQSTDNAYVQAPIIQITPQVGGTVLAVLADDTDLVQAGQPLVSLDKTDAQLALQRAEAQLAQTVREVRTVYANNGALQANIRLREADVAKAQADLARAQDDLNRRVPLAATGAVGGEEMTHAKAVVDSARSTTLAAQAALGAAQEQLASNQSLTEGTDIENHPNVLRAAAAVREAVLALQRTELPAPVTGQIAKRVVQVGQRIAPGAPLMSIIPLEQVWVEANFKESQLSDMRIGQPVKLRADVYGKKVEYDGRVAGMGAGTGASFALLPAQNATGNWIKVVQRVPVRIELDAQQLKEHPLRVGMSTEAIVDVGAAAGAPLARSASRASAATTVFESTSKDAEDRVRQIIAAQLHGGKTSAAQRSTGTPAPAATLEQAKLASARH